MTRGCVDAWSVMLVASISLAQAGCTTHDREVKGLAQCVDCEEGVAVSPNRPLHLKLSWSISCIEHKPFDSKPGYSSCGDQTFDTTLRCEGVACTFDPPEVATSSGKHYSGGSADITVTPNATGDLRITGTLKGSEDDRSFAIPVAVRELDDVVIKCLAAPTRDSHVCSELDADTKLCTYPSSKPCAASQIIDRPEGTAIGIAVYATGGGIKIHAPIEVTFTPPTPPYEETSKGDSAGPPPLIRRWRDNAQTPKTLIVKAKVGSVERTLSTTWQ